MASTPPSPYTSASASADINVSEFMNVDCSIAVRTPMSRTRSGPLGELAGFGGRAAEQLDQRRARRREPLGHLGVHRRVVDGGLARQSRHRRADPSGGQRNSGISTSDSSVICHEMHSITARVSVRVTRLDTTPDKRVGERPLRAHHVVAQPADQCPGAGAREERHRHALHVVEHRGAQIQDQTFADGRGQPARHQRDCGLRDGDGGDDRRQRHDHRPGAPRWRSRRPPGPPAAASPPPSTALITLTADEHRRACGDAAPRSARSGAAARGPPSECRSPPRACVCRYRARLATDSMLMRFTVRPQQ